MNKSKAAEEVKPFRHQKSPSLLEKCLIVPRNPEDILFSVNNDQITCNLFEYAIIPLKEYERLKGYEEGTRNI